MATRQQKSASRKVMDAVIHLNSALQHAGGLGLFVELKDVRIEDSRVPKFIVDIIETRETVLP